MNSDEKLCPYCGETIKVIAIKCKYCKSEIKQVVTSVDGSSILSTGQHISASIKKYNFSIDGELIGSNLSFENVKSAIKKHHDSSDFFFSLDRENYEGDCLQISTEDGLDFLIDLHHNNERYSLNRKSNAMYEIVKKYIHNDQSIVKIFKTSKAIKNNKKITTEKKSEFVFLGPTEKGIFKFLGFLCIIFGFLASLSGIGIIIGIPLIIIGAMSFFIPGVSIVLLALLFIAYKFSGSGG